MPSTYSPSLKLQLIGTGEQAGTWGTTTNYNLGTLLEQAITGVITIPMGDATYTLTNYNGLSDEARNAVLVLNGPITSPQSLIMPPQQKVYIVRNRTGNSVNLSANVGGVNVSIANAASEVIFCDGSNVYSATQFNYINGDLTVTGNVTVGGRITVGGDIYGNTNTGQWYIPVGNTVSRSANGSNGLFRYNTDLQIYEGYQNNVWVKFITANELNYTADYLVVAGGGGGGGAAAGNPGGYGGGGGAGGFFTGSFTVTSGVVYTFTVGAGGAAQTTGTNSSLTGIFTAFGGGRGGDTGTANAGSGGSGGGGAYATSGGSAGGSGVSGQGNKGGDNFDTYYGGGGGGGASFAGAYANNGSGGAGGGGTTSSITGISVTYAGGGGGGASSSGGAGGGGNAGSPGTTYSGGGGGAGASGGSGVIVLSVPTASYSGVYTGTPIITTSGSNTILKYIVSGTYTG